MDLAATVRRWRAWLLGVGATVVFIGSVVLGAGSISNQLPGPFRVSDDARSIDADNLAAADWMSRQPARATASSTATASAACSPAPTATSSPSRHVGTGIDASRLLLDPEFGDRGRRPDPRGRHPLPVADRRNANGLPNQGVYIETGEFGERRTAPTPVPAAALRKFSSVPGVDAHLRQRLDRHLRPGSPR